MRYLFFIFFCSEWISGNGQAINAASPPYFSIINCYSKNFVDVFSIAGNAASCAALEKPAVGIYMERRFMLSELNQYCLVSSVPTKLGAFGFQLDYFGYEGYREIEPSIAFAKKLGVVDLGIKFNYRTVTIPAYGNYASFIPEIGTTWHVTGKVHTGIRIYYPLPNFEAPEKFAYSFSSGIGYEVSALVFLGLSIIKEESKNAEVNTVVQYQFARQLFASLGISTRNAHARFAFGYYYHSLRIDVITGWHPRLGISPGLMIIYESPGKGK